MRTPYETAYGGNIQIQRKLLQGNERLCSEPNFSKCWKALYPHKSAENLASIVGCTVRTAAYELSGEHQPSAQSIKALLDLVVPNWK